MHDGVHVRHVCAWRHHLSEEEEEGEGEEQGVCLQQLVVLQEPQEGWHHLPTNKPRDVGSAQKARWDGMQSCRRSEFTHLYRWVWLFCTSSHPCKG